MIEHDEYPHIPGMLYDCEACEEQCYCGDNYICIHCSPKEPW
jgi:hypothetical protein